MWYVCYLEWNSSAAFWVKMLRLTKKRSENCKPKENLQNTASPLLQNRQTQFLPFCREERQSPFIKEFNLIHRSVLSLACCQRSIHQVTNTQWSTMHSTPTNCYKEEWQDLWAVKLSRSFSTHSGVCHLFALCTPWHSQTELQGAEEHVYERKLQEKGALLGHREQTDRRRDMDIPAFFDQHWSLHSHFHIRRGQVKEKSFKGF